MILHESAVCQQNNRLQRNKRGKARKSGLATFYGVPRKSQDFWRKGANERTRVKLQSNFRLSVVCDASQEFSTPK